MNKYKQQGIDMNNRSTSSSSPIGCRVWNVSGAFMFRRYKSEGLEIDQIR